MFGRFGAWLKRQTTQEARPGIRPCLSAFVVAVVWRNHTTRPSAVGYLLVAARWFVVNVTAIKLMPLSSVHRPGKRLRGIRTVASTALTPGSWGGARCTALQWCPRWGTLVFRRELGPTQGPFQP